MKSEKSYRGIVQMVAHRLFAEGNRVLLLVAFLAFHSSLFTLHAQEDDEYLWEVGVGAGLVSYLGDFNASITSDMQPMGTVVLRRVFNPYIGLRCSCSFGKLKGTSTDVKDYFPTVTDVAEVSPAAEYRFDHSLADVSMTYEYNFWPYGTGRDYRGAQRLTPFVFGGLGATYVWGGEKKVLTANIPIGIGVKYKVSTRMNVGVEWAAHFSLSDELDGAKDPLGVKSSGAFKNKDCYSVLQATLTYSFGPKCRICNKDDD